MLNEMSETARARVRTIIEADTIYDNKVMKLKNFGPLISDASRLAQALARMAGKDPFASLLEDMWKHTSEASTGPFGVITQEFENFLPQAFEAILEEDFGFKCCADVNGRTCDAFRKEHDSEAPSPHGLWATPALRFLRGD